MAQTKRVACKTCKHCMPDNRYEKLWIPIIGWIYVLLWRLQGCHLEYAKCAKSIVPPTTNHITGKTTKLSYRFCSTERDGSYNDCGPDGKWHEPK